MADIDELLLEEDRYSGKVYHLESNHSQSLGFQDLCGELEGEEVNVSDDFAKVEQEDIVIPDVFQQESGSKPSEATITNLSVFNRRGIKGIAGYVKHNDPSTLIYEGKEIFVLESVKTQFLIFAADGKYYLVMLGARELLNSVLSLIDEILDRFGFETRDITISSKGFDLIEDEMIDSLKASTISGYASPNIDKKVVRGEGYQGDSEYERETRIGNVSGHQFGTDAVGDGTPKTVQISKDGLVRCYSNITLIGYLNMIANYVLDAHFEVQSSLTRFSPEDSRALND